MCASVASSGSLASVPTGPVQLTTPATSTWLPSVSVTSRPVPRPPGATRPSRCAGRAGRRRRSRPAGARSPATSGAGGSPTCERARRGSGACPPRTRPCHSCAVTGRRPSIAARQSPVSSTVRSTWASTTRCSSSSVPIRVMPGGGGTIGVVGIRCAAGTRSCRETVCRVRPGRSAAIATSTMVRPVPTSRRSPSGSSSVQGSATVGTAEPGRCPVGARRGPGGEHDGAGDDRLPRREAHREPVAASGDPDHGFLAAFEAGVAGVLRRGLQQAVDVVAVHPPRDEVLRLRLRVVVVAHPAEEVLGVAREGAHPAGGDVEQVAVVGRGVRRPAAGRGATGRPARPGSAATGWSPGGRPSAPPRHRPPPRRHSSRLRLRASHPPLKV